MVLSDQAVRRAKAKGKEYTLADVHGLSLFVGAKGGKSWHFRYYWLGMQKRMSLGTYPAVSLQEARALRDEARTLLAKGTNPRAERKRQREAARLGAGEYIFQAVYRMWLSHRSRSLDESPQSTLGQIERTFAKDVLPNLWDLPIFDVTRLHLLEVIDKIEKRNALSVAAKVRTWLSQLFGYATVVVPGLLANPALGLEFVATPLPPVRHNPFLRLGELPKFLQGLRKYPGELRTQLAIRLLALTGVRTSELRYAIPEQFDLARGLWIISPDRVKQLKVQMRRKRQRPQDVSPYIVPLPIQALEVVRYMLEQFAPGQRYLFPGSWSLQKPISENTLNQALKRMGYAGRLTGHGIRGTISTVLHEIGYPKAWIDAELSHGDSDPTSAPYNHAQYVEQRRVMMQDWADRLDLLEQDQVQAASMHLTMRLEVPRAPDSRALSTIASAAHGPMLMISGTRAEALQVANQSRRLRAVLVPPLQRTQPSKTRKKRLKQIPPVNS